jgi:hypothetical protein
MALRRELNDIWGQGHSLLWKGVNSWAAGRYADGISSLSEAIALFDQTGDPAEMNFARFHLSCCHYAAGNLAESIIEARKTFDLSIQNGDPRANCSLYIWSKAVGGNLPFDRLRGNFAMNPDDILSTCNLDKGEGYWHLYHGRSAEAVAAFERACDQPRKHLLLLYHTIAGMPGRAMALREHAEEIAKSDTSQAKRVRKRAMRMARRAALFPRFFVVERPHAFRELSLSHAAMGSTKKAWKFAVKSCASAEQQKAKYELAQSNLVRAQLAVQLGMPHAAAQVEDSQRVLAEFAQIVKEANALPLGGLEA